MTTLIELKEVWKTYKMGAVDVNALQGLSLTVKKGEFLTILGPSGSGKSTLLHMVGCLDLPTKGSVYLINHNISFLSESNLAQLRGKTIGLVFQQFNLISSLTALENVILPMTFQNISKEKKTERATKLLIDLGLGDRLYHLPSELSGGEQQRVALARALSNNPEVILADEPTGNLDSKTGYEVMQLFSNLHKKEKKTIIMVTHDENLIKHSQRACFLKDGKIIKTVHNGNSLE